MGDLGTLHFAGGGRRGGALLGDELLVSLAELGEGQFQERAIGTQHLHGVAVEFAEFALDRATGGGLCPGAG